VHIFLSPTCQLSAAVSALGYKPDATAWESVCHSKESFAWIAYEENRWVSRWTSEKRVRKWILRVYQPGRSGLANTIEKAYASLDAAKKAAEQYFLGE
jgi:hypothetical protein